MHFREYIGRPRFAIANSNDANAHDYIVHAADDPLPHLSIGAKQYLHAAFGNIATNNFIRLNMKFKFLRVGENVEYATVSFVKFRKR